jgi:hypothetical protein
VTLCKTVKIKPKEVTRSLETPVYNKGG